MLSAGCELQVVSCCLRVVVEQLFLCVEQPLVVVELVVTSCVSSCVLLLL